MINMFGIIKALRKSFDFIIEYFTKLTIFILIIGLAYFSFGVFISNLEYSIPILLISLALLLLIYKKHQKILNILFEKYINIKIFIYSLIFKFIDKFNISNYFNILITERDIYVYEYDDNIKSAEDIVLTDSITERLMNLYGVINEEDLNKLYVIKTNKDDKIIYLFNVRDFIGSNKRLTKLLIKIVENIIKIDSSTINGLSEEYETSYKIKKNDDSYTIVIEWSLS